MMSKKALFIGAHSDDIEYGCAGLIQRLQGWDISLCILTAPEETHRLVREKEAVRSKESLGAGQVLFMNYKDGELMNNSESRSRLRRLVKDIRPDLVVIHTEHDTHPDHIAAAQLCQNACRDVRNVLAFRSYTSTTFMPNLYVDISEYMEAKMEILSGFTSQVEKYKDTIDLLKTIELENRLYGLRNGCRFAEAFEVLRITL